MGVFDFNKDAGASAGNAGGTSLESYMNSKLPQMLDQYGFEVVNPNVQFDNGVVTISGEAANQPTKEKVVLTLGNVKGISQVVDNMTLVGEPTKEEEAAAAAAAVVESKFHTVERGDSLSKIAKKVYGDAMKYPVIFEANKPMLKDPNQIYPGQVLRIPEL